MDIGAIGCGTLRNHMIRTMAGVSLGFGRRAMLLPTVHDPAR